MMGRSDAQKGALSRQSIWTGRDLMAYTDAYRYYTAKLKKKAATDARTKASWNPVTHCATCIKPRREKAFGIYDWANDKFFCNETCEAGRKDLEQ